MILPACKSLDLPTLLRRATKVNGDRYYSNDIRDVTKVVTKQLVMSRTFPLNENSSYSPFVHWISLPFFSACPPPQLFGKWRNGQALYSQWPLQKRVRIVQTFSPKVNKMNRARGYGLECFLTLKKIRSLFSLFFFLQRNTKREKPEKFFPSFGLTKKNSRR